MLGVDSCRVRREPIVSVGPQVRSEHAQRVGGQSAPGMIANTVVALVFLFDRCTIRTSSLAPRPSVFVRETSDAGSRVSSGAFVSLHHWDACADGIGRTGHVCQAQTSVEHISRRESRWRCACR